MDNETTMPGLLTLPAALSVQPRQDHGHPLYKLIFVLAVLALAITFYLV